MKKILLSMLALLLLVGCGSSNKQELRVFNWGAYIDEEVIREFENEFDVHVKYENFFSNEAMYTKMSSEDYDVLVPSDYMIQRLIEEERLQKLDFSKIANASHIDSVYKGRHFDPNNEYSVPYFAGSVGIVYNTKAISAQEIEAKGWDILRDTQYRDRLFFYNSERDAFMVALKALGYSMNTESETELKEAYDWLIALKKEMNPILVDDLVIDAMAAGEKDLAVMYSGDATYVLSENEDLAYIEPKQGTNVWVDAMVIPENAKNVALAHEFINFIASKEVSKAISEEVGYTSPISEVAKEIYGAGGVYEGISAYNPRTNYEKDEEFYFNAKTKVILTELWSKVAASQ